MTAEARLLALAQAYRAQYGDAGLANSVQLAMTLGGQAPDLGAEIRALAAALQMNAAARIAGSADPQSEAIRVASEIATSQQLPSAAAGAGVTVASQLSGGVAPPGVTAPASSSGLPDWVVQNKWAIGIAAVALLIFMSQNQGSGGSQPQPCGGQGQPACAPNGGGGQGGGGQGGGGAQGGGSMPTLATGDNLPTLPFQTRRVNRTLYGGVSFNLPTPNGTYGASVGTTGGWQMISMIAMGPSDTDQASNAGVANLQLTQGQNGPARVGQVQWQRNGLNLPPMCLVFEGGQAQGETAHFGGSRMCVMDASCQQVYGCGRVQ